MPLGAALRDLQIADGDDWTGIPPWAQFYADVGFFCVCAQRPGARLVVGMAVPTRAYAAAFVGLGAVVAAVDGEGAAEEGNAYFEYLCKLKPGTSVLFRDDRSRRILRGVLQGCTVVAGKRMLMVQVTKEAGSTERKGGGQKRLVPPESAFKITTAEGENWRLPGAQKGRRISADTRLAVSLLGDHRVLRLATHSSLDCVIVGEAGVLQKEIVETPVTIGVQEESSRSSCLQDVLRVRKFCSLGQPYRTRIVSAARSRRRALLLADRPRVVAFDGAGGFLRWRDHWPTSNWVVILDRTHRLFESAAASLNEAYVARRTGEPNLADLSSVPPGIELLAFEEASG